MATSQAKTRLLQTAVAHATGGGIVGESLRQIAAALGTSHRMLIYHFGSREGLILAICNQINHEVAGGLEQLDDPKALFDHYADPAARPWVVLFLQLYTHELQGGPDAEAFFDASVKSWIDGIARVLVTSGVDPATARTHARLSVAVARGLLLDLLATGEREEIDRAYDLYLQLAGHPAK